MNTSKFVKQFGVTKKHAASVLRRAAVLIETKGFNKGAYGNDDVGYCALGAIGMASNWITLPATRALQSFLGHSHIPTWNDNQKRTAEEVTKALRGTARALEHGLEVVR